MSSPKDVTQLLLEWSRGDQSALDELMPLVYTELHRLAEYYMGRERSNHTLQPTALIHEAYLRLGGRDDVHCQTRGQFFTIAAQVMRRVLVDHARRHRAAKRGSARRRLSLDRDVPVQGEPNWDLIALDDALSSLAVLDPRQAQIVELRFFGGLTIKETADVVGLSPATVKREWTLARAWLYQEVKRGSASNR